MKQKLSLVLLLMVGFAKICNQMEKARIKPYTDQFFRAHHYEKYFIEFCNIIYFDAESNELHSGEPKWHHLNMEFDITYEGSFPCHLNLENIVSFEEELIQYTHNAR